MSPVPLTDLLPTQEWHLANGDFLSGVAPMFSISMMSSMANLVTKAMKDFHIKADQRMVLMEALKFCVICQEFFGNCQAKCWKRMGNG